MSIGGLMRTSVSGMNAQATRLAGVSDNIANANTNGYKRQTTEFSTMVVASGSNLYNSGSVEANTRQIISQQGIVSPTLNGANSKAVDLAINGNGFLVVSDGSGGTFLTRSGAFVKNGDGDLVNAAGFVLQGYPLPNGDTEGVLNGFAGLQNVNLDASRLMMRATDAGTFRVNLPKDDAAIANPGTTSPGVAGANVGGTVNVSKTDSLVVYDDTGGEVILDVYMTKTGADTWEYAIFNRADRASGTSPFPYGEDPLVVQNLTFDAEGKLTAPTPASISFEVPNGKPMVLDIGGTSHVSRAYEPLKAEVNGYPPSNVDQIEIGANGIVSAKFKHGQLVPLFKIPLAMVESPDNLRTQAGNVYSASLESGEILLGFGGESGLGSLVHGALEQSTVDLASELTTMIESQRSYTANSKVFQTGSEILDVLVNLKR